MNSNIKSGYFMNARLKIVLLLILASLLVSGCTGGPSNSLGNPDFGPYGSENYERQVEAGSYTTHQIDLNNSTRVKVDVSTDGSPVNVLIVDQQGLDQYRKALSGFAVNWTPKYKQTNINRTSFNYGGNVSGTYYLIVENAGTAGGALAPSVVRANVTVEYQKRKK